MFVWFFIKTGTLFCPWPKLVMFLQLEKLSEPACSQPVDTYYSIFLCTVACCYFVLILMELNVYFKSWTVVFLSINVHLLQIQNCIFICYIQSRVFCFPWHVWWNLCTLTLQHWNEIHNLRTNKLIVLQRILLLICVPYAHLRRIYYLYFFNICWFFYETGNNFLC